MVEGNDNNNADKELLGDPEPWEAWESRLVGICLLLAVAGLVVLGWLINRFILV